MPNTLAHLGLQAVTTRALFRGADLRWIYLGAIVPDLPWIVQRAIRTLAPGIDLLDLRLYSIAQASLFVSLFACAALAALSAAPRRVFGILALNSLLHLLLDAAQTKWANGVHLFAPFSWELLNLELFWPESLPNYLITAFGLVYLLWSWKRRGEIRRGGRKRPGPGRVAAAGALGTVYLALPLILRAGPLAADNHSIATLRERELRPGRSVSFDRAAYERRGGEGVLRTFTGNEFVVLDPPEPRAPRVSVHARFVGEDSILIRQSHWHRYWPRDLLSYLGLVLVTLFWMSDGISRAGWARRAGRRDFPGGEPT